MHLLHDHAFFFIYLYLIEFGCGDHISKNIEHERDFVRSSLDPVARVILGGEGIENTTHPLDRRGYGKAVRIFGRSFESHMFEKVGNP
jgi:hypothetical protein